MAARKNKIRHDENTIAKIKTTQLLNRLQDHGLGLVDLSQTQVRSIEILLRKTLPDLSAVESKNETTVRYVARMPNKAETPAAWQHQHAPELTKH